MDKSKRHGLNTMSGTAIAVAAASLFLSGAVPAVAADTKEAKVHCVGVNSCKGKSECSSARNGCKGQNQCKGEGWMSMSEQECKAKGGKVEKG